MPSPIRILSFILSLNLILAVQATPKGWPEPIGVRKDGKPLYAGTEDDSGKYDCIGKRREYYFPLDRIPGIIQMKPNGQRADHRYLKVIAHESNTCKTGLSREVTLMKTTKLMVSEVHGGPANPISRIYENRIAVNDLKTESIQALFANAPVTEICIRSKNLAWYDLNKTKCRQVSFDPKQPTFEPKTLGQLPPTLMAFAEQSVGSHLSGQVISLPSTVWELNNLDPQINCLTIQLEDHFRKSSSVDECLTALETR